MPNVKGKNNCFGKKNVKDDSVCVYGYPIINFKDSSEFEKYRKFLSPISVNDTSSLLISDFFGSVVIISKWICISDRERNKSFTRF